MADDNMILPKSGYVPKQKNLISKVNKASNFDSDTKKYLVKELNKILQTTKTKVRNQVY